MGFFSKLFGKSAEGSDTTGERIGASEKLGASKPPRMIAVGNGSCHGCKISGGWKDGYVWTATNSYLVEEDPDLNEFFSRETLPYLLPGNVEYIKSVASDDDPGRQSRVHWALAYIHHPNPTVVVRAFRANIPFNLYPLNREVIWFLIDPNDDVAREAARAVWRFSIDLESVFNRLTGRHAPTGVTDRQIKRACKLLQLECPKGSRSALDAQIRQIKA
jgi:hypothetical protein